MSFERNIARNNYVILTELYELCSETGRLFEVLNQLTVQNQPILLLTLLLS